MAAGFSTPGLKWSVPEDGIGVITLSRPPVNALNWQMKRAMLERITEIRDSAAVRALVIASDLPRTFCAGSDLRELVADHDRPGSASERTRFEFDMWQALSALPQPSIAAVEGHALGSGLELSVACDFRVASEAATFGLPEIKIGGAPGVQTLGRLPLLIGLGAARRMLLLGESITAANAQALGLVDELTPPGAALSASLVLARRLARLPSSSIRFLKGSLTAATEGPINRAEAVVMGGVEALFLAPEMREGIRAFLEKRPPDFIAAAARKQEAVPR